MKYLLKSFFLFFLVTSCKENVSKEQKRYLFPIKIGDYWGLVDSTCNLISQPVFSSMGYFYNGIALVNKDGKCSYLNDSGKVLGDFNYLSATHFSEGLAFVVSPDHIITCVDTSLKPLFTLQDVDHAEIFSCGMAAVHKDGKYGYIDKSGKIIIDFQYDVVAEFSENIAAVGSYASGSDTGIVNWFYIDRSGNKLFEDIFISALPFHEGKAAVQKEDKMYWVDTLGKKLFNAEFDECRSFSVGYATFRSDEKWGIMQGNGKILLEPSYPFIGNCSESLFPFSLGPEAFGYLDTLGIIKIQPKYKAASAFRNGFAYVLLNNKLSIISKNGLETCSDRFDSAPGYFGAMLGFIETPLNSSVDINKPEENLIAQ